MAAKNNCFRSPFLGLLAVAHGLLSSLAAADEALASPNYRLAPGQSLVNCGYTLTMQMDCNLVLSDNGNAVWSSGTDAMGTGCQLVLQGDGNLVIYDGEGASVWSTGTNGREGHYVLVLQRDRNVVVYGGDIWSMGTSINSVAVSTGAQDAVIKNETSAGAMVVLSSATSDGSELGLGRKINMVANKA